MRRRRFQADHFFAGAGRKKAGIKDMKRKMMWRLWLTGSFAVVVLLASLGWSQAMAKVHGKCTDETGKPLEGATVEWLNHDTGQKYKFKTDKKGEYFSIAVNTGKYKVTLFQDDKLIMFFDNVPVTLTEDGTEMDFNLAKERTQTQPVTTDASGAVTLSAEQQKRLSPEQKKQLEELQKKNAAVATENAKIKGLNEKLAEANAAQTAGNWAQAVSILTETTQMDPNRDLLWARLGEAELGAAGAAKDKDEATQDYQKASDAYQKAVQLKPTDGGYHNNLGQAYAKTGKPKEALAEYSQAAQVDPLHAAMYYFNGGAILTNASTRESDPATKAKDIDEANISFDKAIQAKPDYAEAWFQKGINLISKATYDNTGKIVAAPGTVDAFNKYLELDPNGKHAQEAVGIIEGLGEKVSTTYHKAKAEKK
jgi:tetratricopeptide (TPR) repeat protein